MAVSIYNNLMSLNSQRHLGGTQSALGKSLERLSSGLRINHAADDASGMAISEKLRGQISGLKRSMMNAQDGISMLQTAEGALAEVSSMLQRMRELAVQAANGTYTSNDRVELQKEVEQLKAEVNRISTATEFNTKKLLNGDGTALWSASSNKVSAIIRGNVAEGNYEISVNANKIGANQIFKTDIMTLQEGKIGAEINTTIGTSSANNTNIAYVKDPQTMPTTGTAYFTVTIGETSGADADTSSFNGIYQQAGSSWSVANGGTAVATFSGYIEVEFLKDINTVGVNTSAFRYRIFNASDGTIATDWTIDDLSANGIAVGDLGGIASATLTITSGQKITAGDKMLIAFSDRGTVAANAAASGGGTISLSNGPAGYTGPSIEYGANTLTKLDNGDGTVDYNDVTVYYAELDQSTGNLNLGNITFGFKEQPDNGSGNAATQTDAFDMIINGGGDVATTTTKLKDIARFVDADGNNLFDNKQELTIWGNGTSTVIYLEADDTISDFETKLTEAIVDKLGLGSSNTQVNNHLVDYVSIAGSGNYAVKGTFVIQTALAGEQGEIAFSGDQRLIDAMSLAEIQKTVGNTTTITIKDAHTGDLVGLDETGNDRVSGIIQGIEVLVDSRANVSASWDGDNIVFSPNTTNDSYFLHVVDNSTDLQIGPNQGQSLSVSIPQLDVKGLGIDNVYLVSQKLAQRAIPDIDNALGQVVTIRATIGSQINRLEHTVANLSVAHENMTASESRIRDLDVAEEMSMFTRSQILSQAGTAMLAQANQIPQMALQLLQG